jgi:hypothetical protein
MDERLILKTDGKIDLTIPKDFEEYDNTFDIYLHNTDEMIGRMWFDEGFDEDFTKYFGMRYLKSIDERDMHLWHLNF